MNMHRRDLGATVARHRRVILLWTAVLPLAVIPFDWYYAGRVDLRLVVLRLLWSASFLAASVLTRRYGSAVAGLVDFGISLSSSLFVVYFVLLTGGARGPFLAWCLVLPLAISLLVRGQIRDVVVSALVCNAAMLYFVREARLDARTVAAWGSSAVIAAFLAVFGSILSSRVSGTLINLRTFRQRSARQRGEREHARVEHRRLELVSQLAAGVAHEVNNPLAIIKSNLSLLRSELRALSSLPVRDDVLESIHEAMTGTERIRLIVRGLASFSQHGLHVSEQCAVPGLVEDVVELSRHEIQVPIHTEIAPHLPPIHVVRPEVVRVFRSLIRNAAEAIEDAAPGPSPLITLRASADALGVRIDVEDTGPGLSASTLPRLFEPFFTTKAVGKGSGMALAVSRELLQRSGSSIAASNRPGGGACFTVRFAPPAGTELPLQLLG
jgi:two-component system NtrC family sensor kinase